SWAVGHAETRAEMLGKKQHGVPVTLLVLLHQVAHRVHQQALAFNVAGISATRFSFASRRIGQNRDGEYLSQKQPRWVGCRADYGCCRYGKPIPSPKASGNFLTECQKCQYCQRIQIEASSEPERTWELAAEILRASPKDLLERVRNFGCFWHFRRFWQFSTGETARTTAVCLTR